MPINAHEKKAFMYCKLVTNLYYFFTNVHLNHSRRALDNKLISLASIKPLTREKSANIDKKTISISFLWLFLYRCVETILVGLLND